MYQDITKLYPEELLFSIPMSENNGYIDYGVDVEQEMTEFLINNLKNYVEEAKLFQCVVQA
jgi:spore photoproduct lyase